MTADVLDLAEDIPLTPPAGIARSVLDHKQKLFAERDNLRAGAAELALKSSQGDTKAQAELAAIPARYAALTLEIDLNAEVYELASKIDADAEGAWRASIHSLAPAEAIEGLNRDECCRRCQPGVSGGCVLSGGAPFAGSTCMHPTRLDPFHQFRLDDSGRKIFPLRDHPRAAEVFDAACDALKVRGKFV